jgi:hypothetical protein
MEDILKRLCKERGILMKKRNKIMQFIAEHKGQIIKGGLVVVGIVGGIILVRRLTISGGKVVAETLESLRPEELAREAFEVMEEVAETVTDVVV